MAVYNVEKINNWLSKFSKAKTDYNDDYLKYKDTYIYTTTESTVNRIKQDLNKNYDRIQRIYKNIYDQWNRYLNDLKATDNYLAGTGSAGSVKASSVSSKLSKLPKLKKYEAGTYEKLSAVNAKIGTIKTVGWTDGKTTDENITNVIEKTGATISVATMSVLEGVGIFAEGLVDCAALVVGGVGTALNYTYGFFANDLDTSDELNELMWKDVRAFVSKEHVKSAFDSFYEKTEVGKSMKENAIGFDTVRSVGNEVGEVVGAVTVSALTGGVVNPAVLYGASKVGNHTEENWQDESTSTAAGLVKGVFQGVGDGVFFAIGLKGDKVMKTAVTEAVKQGGKQTFKKVAILGGKTLFECGCSVAQDGSNILINTLFSGDTVKTQDGEVVKLDTFGDKLNYYYQEAGGAQGLVTSMATAGILSFTSDYVDISKIGKSIDTNTAIKNADISANNMKNTIEGINPKNIEASVNPMKSDINLDYLRKEYDDLINWKNSDEGLYSKRLNEVYGDRYGNNSRYKRNMDRLKELEDIFSKNTNSSPSEINVGASKAEVDELYRFNNEKYKNIPGYENYYDLQRIQRNKNNLDRASEILNNWGKNQGVDNYAEQALRKYADTGSAYNVNGTPYITSSNGVRQYIESLDPQDVSFYLKNKTLGSSSNDQLYNFFRNNGSSINSTYGVNQGGIKELCRYSLNGREYTYKSARNIINNAMENGEVLPRFQKQATQEYFTLKNKLILKGMTNEQASIILSSLDDVGACSYAAKANSIFYQFSNNPELFQQKFGFPMYKVDSNGVKTFNSNELILDMYIYANDTANGGNLFTKNIYNNSYNFSCDNRIDVFGRRMLDTQRQIYMSTSNGSNVPTLNGYLNSKGLNFESYNLITNKGYNILNNQEFNAYINAIDTSITEGKSVQLNIFLNGNEIRMLSMDNRVYPDSSTRTWGEGGGHAVFITGRNIQGFTVSSWGKEYLIPYSDLQNGGYFNIMIDNVS